MRRALIVVAIAVVVVFLLRRAGRYLLYRKRRKLALQYVHDHESLYDGIVERYKSSHK